MDILAKAAMPLAAAQLDETETDAWLAGKIARRMLAIPFGGPIASPHSPRGVDLDGQWFSERTDLYAGFPKLRETRDRVVDWHHSLAPLGGRGGDPLGRMNGVSLGKAVLDEDDSEDGRWADFWIRKGMEGISLVRRLAERATQLFASGQPAAPGKADPLTGEITEFPLLMVTVTTSPQNTLAVVTPKALLDGLDLSEIPVSKALRSLLAELDAFRAELPSGLAAVAQPGSVAVKAGLVSILEPLESVRDSLVKERSQHG